MNMTHNLKEITTFTDEFPQNCITQLLDMHNVDDRLINRKLPQEIVTFNLLIRFQIDILKEGAI